MVMVVSSGHSTSPRCGRSAIAHWRRRGSPLDELLMSKAEIEYLDVAGRRVAYRLRPGGSPTLVFLPGYASDMDGTKALALDAFAERRGLAMLRFDYSGTGSSAGRLEEGTLALW